MVQSLGELFDTVGSQVEASDVRHFVQQRLREDLKDIEIHCEQADSGVVMVRVSHPLIAQEVLMRELELRETVKDESGKTLGRLIVRVG